MSVDDELQSVQATYISHLTVPNADSPGSVGSLARETIRPETPVAIGTTGAVDACGKAVMLFAIACFCQQALDAAWRY